MIIWTIFVGSLLFVGALMLGMAFACAAPRPVSKPNYFGGAPKRDDEVTPVHTLAGTSEVYDGSNEVH